VPPRGRIPRRHAGELPGLSLSPGPAAHRTALAGHRADIYSLGATLFELLTLEAPFPSNDPQELLQHIAGREPRRLRALDAAIPTELAVIVLKALAKAPSKRYPTAEELADDLERFLKDQPILARPPSLADRLFKWSRRHKTAVLAALVLLVVALAGLSVSTLLIARSGRPSRRVTEALFPRDLDYPTDAPGNRARTSVTASWQRKQIARNSSVSWLNR